MSLTHNKKRTVVAFLGRSGAGKSTAARYLVEQHGFKRIGFGDPIRAAIMALGLDPKALEGEHKDLPNELLCGVTPRRAMQTLGTEWGRKLIAEKIWENNFQTRIDRESCPRIAVDDVRFPGEVELLRKTGGKLIWIERAQPETMEIHISDASVYPAHADHIVSNDRSVADLLLKIDKLIDPDC